MHIKLHWQNPYQNGWVSAGSLLRHSAVLNSQVTVCQRAGLTKVPNLSTLPMYKIHTFLHTQGSELRVTLLFALLETAAQLAD